MKCYLVPLVILVGVVDPANAWNDRGHMVVARIAWQQLTPAERAQVIKMFEVHPHLEEFLKDGRPGNIPEDGWIFMRAATWSDWVRGGPPERRKFNDSIAHYVNLPFVLPGSDTKPPKVPGGNILKKLSDSRLIAKMGSREKAAIHLCWIFHLVGDIHQPLHCAALFSDEFPKGDRGGNLSLIKIDGRVVQMHQFWDHLLGASTTLSAISKTVQEIEKMVEDHPQEIQNDLANHKTPNSWATEGLELARRIAYRNGKLHPANAEDDPDDRHIPRAPDDYAEEAGETARYCVAKAGRRLALMLREVLDGK